MENIENLIYQKFILGTGRNLDFALSKQLGGVIFFTKDIQSKEQFVNLIKNIKSKSKISPFLSIDQEGGRVERTENIHGRSLSPKYAYERGFGFLEKQSNKIATELKDYGINLNFAPCADVNTNPNNPIIGERSYSDNPDIVKSCVELVSDVYRKNNIIPCLKHYPGHGDASKDSHLTLPQIDLTLKEMEDVHIKPFAENLQTEMIMAAHLHCTCFDKDVIPASLSKNAIGYLRKVLRYKGVIITDDMVMQGVQAFGSVEACVMAIEAGVDMFIYREANDIAINTINELIQEVKKSKSLIEKIDESNSRIMRLKKEWL